MSLRRRIELLEWARRECAWIIEDDYDSEFRYEGRPTDSLQSMDTEGLVAFVGTFSKLLQPELRIGYMIADERLIGAFSKGRARIDVHTSGIGQVALAEFMREGHLLRHLRRMRKVYAERRAALISSGLEIPHHPSRSPSCLAGTSGPMAVASSSRGISTFVRAAAASS